MPNEPPPAEVVTTWFGTFRVRDGRVERAVAFPDGAEALAERLRLRRRGELAPEEGELLRDPGTVRPVTTDRRLQAEGATPARRPGPYPDLAAFRPLEGSEQLRELLLADAARALVEAWDPAVHLEEAVRASEELDKVANLLGERLFSWAGRDEPALLDAPEEKLSAVVRQLSEPVADPRASDLPGPERELAEARRQLAQLYLAVDASRASLASAIEATIPKRAPALGELLGPALAAQLIAKAGGLDRLARLPSSTVQVLGAERAFFEHLRGRAPPPRHGLLFRHPTIQGAPKRLRGKLARALAGKASIAARRDSEGSGVAPGLTDAYRRRAAEIRALPAPAARERRRARRATRAT